MLKVLIIALLIVVSLNSSFGQRNERLYPDGYYFTETVIQNHDWIFEWLSIAVKPVEGTSRAVSARFRNFKTQKWIDIETKNYVISIDSMKVTFSNTRIGQLSFQGTFIHLGATSKENDSKNFRFSGTFTYNGQTIPIKFSMIDGD